MEERGRRRVESIGSRVLFAAVLCACGPALEDADSSEDAYPHFTVRGRLEDPSPLRYHIETGTHIETGDAPLGGESFRRAIERAMEPWSRTGLIEFSPAAAGDTPDLTFAWRRAAHGSCEPFGASTAIAHSGPVGRDTFVHFDAGRTWSEDGRRGESLFHAALHEIGLVLGLGHSAAPDAVMSEEYRSRGGSVGGPTSGSKRVTGIRAADMELFRSRCPDLLTSRPGPPGRSER